MKVGRPLKYLDDETRKEIRKLQNRETQRKCRLRKKTLEEIKSFTLTPKYQGIRYRNEIVNHFNKYDFNYFFTGTINPNYLERREIQKHNEEIKYLNQVLETDLSFYKEKRIGINSLRKYTERYIQFLYDRKLIKRWFVVFEMGKYFKYHVHIMFGTDRNSWSFKDFSENHWLLGTSITEPIKTEKDKLNLMSYCVKEFNPKSHKIQDINKIDNWFFDGDFEIGNIPSKEIKRTIPTPQSVFLLL